MIYPTPYNRALVITKSDTVNIDTVNGTPMAAIFIGGAGNIVAAYADGTTQTFKGLLAGTIYPIQCLRVNSTSTTATDMLALFQL